MKKLTMCVLFLALCAAGFAACAQGTPADAEAWRAIYLDRLSQDDLDPNGEYGYTYALIYVDEDDVPELVVDTQIEAGGCLLLTVHDGALDELTTDRRYFTYLERENLLCNADGLMGYYHDDIYAIQDGKWTLVASGEYHSDEGEVCEWSDELGRYVCAHYSWNGEETTQEQYMEQYRAAYDAQRAQEPPQGESLEQMRARLQEG